MNFNNLQAIEYALAVFDMSLYNERRIEIPKRKLVFCYDNKLFTATTILNEDAFDPLTIKWDLDKVSYQRSSPSIRNQQSLFSIVHNEMKDKYNWFPSNKELLEYDHQLLFQSIKENIGNLSFPEENESPSIFRHVEFLESDLTLPFLDFGQKTNDVELVSIIVDN